MATRRIRSTINNKYTQPLKLRMGRKIVLTPGCDYNCVLFTQRHRAFDIKNQRISLWAKFNTNTFDGIQIVAWLEGNDGDAISSGSCQFKVYYLDVTDNWSQSLIFTGSGTASGLKWVASPNQASLGPTNDFSGSRTIMVEASILKWGQLYTKKVYVNHLGIYNSFVRLKNDVEFLDISKADL